MPGRETRGQGSGGLDADVSPLLQRLASVQGRRDARPNQILARELVAAGDGDAVRELVANLDHPVTRVRSDCIKVLYEIGYLAPEMIAPHVDRFIDLLGDKNNRMVWGAMIALATVAPRVPEALFARRQTIQAAIDRGSVITVDRGIEALSAVAAADASYREVLWPYLLDHLRKSRLKDVPSRAESILQAVDGARKEAFIEVVRARMAEARPSQVRRLKKVVERAAQRQGT